MLPKHGFARSLAWSVLDPSRTDAMGQTGNATLDRPSSSVALVLTHRALSREMELLWPHKFEAVLQVRLEKDRLAVTFSVRNRDREEWSFASALHTYLRVPDIAQASVQGLQGVRYWDAVKDLKAPEIAQPQGVEDLFFSGETDRVYRAAPAIVRLCTPGAPLAVEQSRSFTETVVWNPGAALCAQLADMPSDGYREMLCIEAARIDQAISLKPGAHWQGSQTLSVAQH